MSEALVLGLAAEVRQPLTHGEVSPPPRDHVLFILSVCACHVANGMEGVAPGRQAKVEHPVESSERAEERRE